MSAPKLKTVQEVAQEIIDADEVSVEPILREWAEAIIRDCEGACEGPIGRQYAYGVRVKLGLNR